MSLPAAKHHTFNISLASWIFCSEVLPETLRNGSGQLEVWEIGVPTDNPLMGAAVFR